MKNDVYSHFGVYQKGSFFRGTEHILSDIDLIVIIKDQIPIREFLDIKTQILNKYPDWKKKELDIQYIIAEKVRPPKAADITSLAFLKQHGVCLLGTDLRSECFEVTWDDYLYCLHRLALYRIKDFKNITTKKLIEEMKAQKNSKFLYAMIFSCCLYQQAKNNKGSWLFSAEDIKDPFFIDSKTVLRDNAYYQLPQVDSDWSVVEKICDGFINIASNFPVKSQ